MGAERKIIMFKNIELLQRAGRQPEDIDKFAAAEEGPIKKINSKNLDYYEKHQNLKLSYCECKTDSKLPVIVEEVTYIPDEVFVLVGRIVDNKEYCGCPGVIFMYEKGSKEYDLMMYKLNKYGINSFVNWSHGLSGHEIDYYCHKEDGTKLFLFRRWYINK